MGANLKAAHLAALYQELAQCALRLYIWIALAMGR
jgi:hypothetical protein